MRSKKIRQNCCACIFSFINSLRLILIVILIGVQGQPPSTSYSCKLPSGVWAAVSDPITLIYENDLYPQTCIPKMNFLGQSFRKLEQYGLQTCIQIVVIIIIIIIIINIFKVA